MSGWSAASPEVTLNEPAQDKRIAILNTIVAEDYIQHNPLAPEGRQGLIDFIRHLPGDAGREIHPS